MKKGKSFLLRGVNGLLGGLLAMLGFSTCETEDMYGSPHVDFTIKGTVLNEANDPLPDIQVRISPYALGVNRLDTLYTDEKGKFTCKNSCLGFEKFGEIPFLFSDVDGEANKGTYESDSIAVSFDKDELKEGDKEWLVGTIEKNIVVKLKEKQDNE